MQDYNSLLIHESLIKYEISDLAKKFENITASNDLFGLSLRVTDRISNPDPRSSNRQK